VVFRKVFNKKHTDQVPYYSKGVDVDLEVYLDAALANPEHKDMMADLQSAMLHFYYFCVPELTSWRGLDKERYERRKFLTASAAPDRESSDDVWQHFTRINTKDPDVVYAACHHCDRVLRAHSKNGTSHLRRHRKRLFRSQ